MKPVILLIALAFFTFVASAQQKPEYDSVTVKIDDLTYLIRVGEKNNIRNIIGWNVYPPYKAGFQIDTSEITCELKFTASAIKKRNGEALVTLNMRTADRSKNSSFDKQLVVKRGEKKDLKLKSRLKCMDHIQYSVTVSY